MSSFIRKNVFFIIPVVMLFLSAIYMIQLRQRIQQLKSENQDFAIKVDSLEAENSIHISQMNYLVRFYDSSKKKIPQPRGVAFISDTVLNQTEK